MHFKLFYFIYTNYSTIFNFITPSYTKILVKTIVSKFGKNLKDKTIIIGFGYKMEDLEIMKKGQNRLR